MTQQKIQNLDPSKARGHDKISIHMIQLRGNTFCKLEEPISNSLWKVVLFRLNAINGMNFQFIKKMKMFKKYRSISLLPIYQLYFPQFCFYFASKTWHFCKIILCSAVLNKNIFLLRVLKNGQTPDFSFNVSDGSKVTN